MAEKCNRSTIKNPMVEDMVAQGRLKICPYKTAHKPVTADVNFDALHTRLHALVAPCYTHWDALVNRYCFGSRERATADITSDVSDMIAFALLSLYNRLRAISQRFNLQAFTTRMSTRAPVASTMRYPDYLCRLLNGVGWLRVDDRPLDFFLHFVAREGTHYGWTKIAQMRSNLGCERLITNLIASGVKMSSIDTSLDLSPGSWWPTCRVELSEGSINVMGTFHRSHYTMDDAFFATALKPGDAELPFQDFSFTAEYGYDEATRTALASTCPSAAAIPRRAVDDGEKGCTRYYSCYLLRDAGDCEIASNMLTEFRSSPWLV